MRNSFPILALLVAIILLLGFGYFLEVHQNSQLRGQATQMQQELEEVKQASVTASSAPDYRSAFAAKAKEVERLRAEVKQLQAQAQAAATNLPAQETGVPASPTPAQQPQPAMTHAQDLSVSAEPAPNEFGAVTREKLDAYICRGHLDQISLAVDTWAREHNGYAPTNLFVLRDLLAPMVLVCPGTKPKTIARNWDELDPKAISYVMRAPGANWDFLIPGRGAPSTQPYLDCPVHGTVLFNRTHMVGIPSKWRP